MIDLHCHTTYSDGTWSVTELLKKAEEKGIEVLSITDHDSAKAYFELEKVDRSKYYKGKLLVGAEINCVFNDTKIELLAYDFNKEKVQEWLNSMYGEENVKNSFIKEFNDMVDICKNNNIKLSNNLLYNPDKEYPIDVIYYDVIKYEENKKYIEEEVWNSKSLFFRKCTTDKDFILYRDFTKDYPKAEDVANIIHKNGGKVFLAHLFVYKMNDHKNFLNNIVDANILDGIECYHSNFTKEQTEFLLDYCKNNKLYVSGGSDCHGDKHQDRVLGALNINLDIIKNWHKKA